jgi:hypothetical protein
MSVKDFEHGMVVGAKPFEEVYKKQEAALRCVADGLSGKLDSIGEVQDALIEDMNSIQRKELYDLNAPPIDIKSFEQEEKEYLVAGLYTLAARCKNTSPFQKAFALSIQNYLGIQTPQTIIDLSKIASVDSVKTQRAVMQVFMEYLFLEKEDFAFLAEYPDVFKSFSVAEKDQEDILQAVHNVYKTVDSMGFIEKYGFVPETPQKSEAEFVIRESLAVDNILYIPANTEKRFEAKEIAISADIHCEGKLVFENCVVKYDGSSKLGKIRAKGEGSILFSSCSVTDANCEDSGSVDLSGYSALISDENRKGILVCEKTSFHNCFLFSKGIKVQMKDCRILFTAGISKGKDDGCFIIDESYMSEESEVTNCLIENVGGTFEEGEDYRLLVGLKSITGCTFKNISSGHRLTRQINSKEIKRCFFSDCKWVIGTYGAISYCLFENCQEAILYVETIKECQFINCSTALDLRHGKVLYCQFFNTKGNALCISIPYHSLEVKSCTFDGFDGDGYLIDIGTGILTKKPRSFRTVTIEDCVFKNCITKKVADDSYKALCCTEQPYYHFKKVAYQNIASFSNCHGLENVNKEGSEADNPPIRHETEQGEPIGARLDGIYGAEQQKAADKEGEV